MLKLITNVLKKDPYLFILMKQVDQDEIEKHSLLKAFFGITRVHQDHVEQQSKSRTKRIKSITIVVGQRDRIFSASDMHSFSIINSAT